MPKVKFLQDFRGKETREAFYKKGDVVDVDNSVADAVVSGGRAELVKEAAPVLVYQDNTPQFENAAEPPRPEEPKRKRGRK